VFGIWLLALTATIGATDSHARAVESFTGTHVNGTNQVPYPDGVTAGDTLVITAIAWATGTGTPGGSAMPWAVPDGFVEVLNQAVTNANGVTGRVAVFTRTADGSESGTVAVAGWDGYNLVGWSTGDVSVYMTRVSGGGSVAATASASNNATTWTCQGIDAPADSVILLHVGSTMRNIKAQAPSGMTALENPGNTKRSLFRQGISAAGATGTRSGVYQFGGASAACVMVSVGPA
jgi:hypothetical protein